MKITCVVYFEVPNEIDMLASEITKELEGQLVKVKSGEFENLLIGNIVEITTIVLE